MIVQKKLFMETISSLFIFRYLNYKLSEINPHKIIISFPIIKNCNIFRYNLKLDILSKVEYNDHIILNIEDLNISIEGFNINDLLIDKTDMKSAIEDKHNKLEKENEIVIPIKQKEKPIFKKEIINIDMNNFIDIEKDKNIFDINLISNIDMKQEIENCKDDEYILEEKGLTIHYVRKNLIFNCINAHIPIYYNGQNRLIQSRNYLNLNNNTYVKIYYPFIKSLIDNNIVKYKKSKLDANNDIYQIICDLHSDFVKLDLLDLKDHIKYFNNNFNLTFDNYDNELDIKIYPSISFINCFNHSKRDNVKIGFRIHEDKLDLEFFIYPFEIKLNQLNNFNFKENLNNFLNYICKTEIKKDLIKKYTNRIHKSVLKDLMDSDYKYNYLSLYFIIEHVVWMAVNTINITNDLNKEITDVILKGMLKNEK